MDLLLMERQAHLRALEDASSDEDIKAHLLIAKWLRGLVEFSLPELLEKAQYTLEGADKPSDTDYSEFTFEVIRTGCHVRCHSTHRRCRMF